TRLLGVQDEQGKRTNYAFCQIPSEVGSRDCLGFDFQPYTAPALL
ncbi:MAG: hypothetical protein RL548_959, partial [Bacteroidota bacterium]